MRLARLLRPVRAALALTCAALLGACAADPATAPRGAPADGPSRLLVPFTSVAQVAAGGSHTCAVAGAGAFTDAGTLTCWGDDAVRQASPPAGVSPYASVDASAQHTCAVTARAGLPGFAVCWGFNQEGQTSPPLSLTDVAQVDVGDYHSCARTTAGAVVCWGSDNSGQSTVPAGLGPVAQVSAGLAHTCAVTTAGAVVCWGGTDAGEAVPPAGLTGVTQVSAGDNFTCARTGAGTAVCWGSNSLGQRNVPADLSGVVQVSAGRFHACAVTGSGSVRCWGFDSAKQSTPPAGLTNARQVSAGAFHSCAATAIGAVVCWGNSGNGRTTVPAAHVPTIRVDPTGTFSANPSPAVAGQPLTLALEGAQVPGYSAATQFTYRFDCGDGQGYGAFAAAASRTCTPTSAGPRTVRGAVRDQDGDVQEYALLVTVQDPSPPVVTPVITGTLGANGWYRTDVSLAWTVTDPQSGVASLTGCGQVGITADTPGLTFSCAATSAGGTSAPQSVTLKRDATPPALTAAVTPVVVVQHGSISVTANATDALSGVAAPASCGSVSSAVVGLRRVLCTATDNAGNVATASPGYAVVGVTLAVNASATRDRRTGVVTVSGTAACTGTITVPVAVALTQAVKSGRTTTTVTGTAQGTVGCAGAGTAAWSLAVTSAGDRAFDAGTATAQATVPGTSPSLQSPVTTVQVR